MRLAILLAVLLACACSKSPPERASPKIGAAAVHTAPPVVSITGPLHRVGRMQFVKESFGGSADHHDVVVVATIQPIIDPDAGPFDRAARLEIREAHLRVNPYGQSIIGGLPPDAPPGTEPALIRIDDCVIDSRIVLGQNVRVEDSVIRVPHAESYDGGLPLFPHSRPAP